MRITELAAGKPSLLLIQEYPLFLLSPSPLGDKAVSSSAVDPLEADTGCQPCPEKDRDLGKNSSGEKYFFYAVSIYSSASKYT